MSIDKPRVKILRGDASTEMNKVKILAEGQPLFDTSNKYLYIGNGKDPIKDLTPISVSEINGLKIIQDENGVLKIKYDVGEDGIIPKKLLMWSGSSQTVNLGSFAPLTNKILQIETSGSLALGQNEIHTIRVNYLSGPQTPQNHYYFVGMEATKLYYINISVNIDTNKISISTYVKDLTSIKDPEIAGEEYQYNILNIYNILE